MSTDRHTLDAQELRRLEAMLKEINRELSRVLNAADDMRGMLVDLDTEIEQTSEVANLRRYSHNEKRLAQVLAAYDKVKDTL